MDTVAWFLGGLAARFHDPFNWAVLGIVVALYTGRSIRHRWAFIFGVLGMALVALIWTVDSGQRDAGLGSLKTAQMVQMVVFFASFQALMIAAWVGLETLARRWKRNH